MQMPCTKLNSIMFDVSFWNLLGALCASICWMIFVINHGNMESQVSFGYCWILCMDKQANDGFFH
jgi:hypothetical protein